MVQVYLSWWIVILFKETYDTDKNMHACMENDSEKNYFSQKFMSEKVQAHRKQA